jgi:hypothetical protein
MFRSVHAAQAILSRGHDWLVACHWMFHPRKIYHLRLPSSTQPRKEFDLFRWTSTAYRDTLDIEGPRPLDTIQAAGATLGTLILLGKARNFFLKTVIFDESQANIENDGNRDYGIGDRIPPSQKNDLKAYDPKLIGRSVIDKETWISEATEHTNVRSVGGATAYYCFGFVQNRSRVSHGEASALAPPRGKGSNIEMV